VHKLFKQLSYLESYKAMVLFLIYGGLTTGYQKEVSVGQIFLTNFSKLGKFQLKNRS